MPKIAFACLVHLLITEKPTTDTPCRGNIFFTTEHYGKTLTNPYRHSVLNLM